MKEPRYYFSSEDIAEVKEVNTPKEANRLLEDG